MPPISTCRDQVSASGQPVVRPTPRRGLPRAQNRWGVTRGVTVHYSIGGEKRVHFPLFDDGDSNPVVDIILRKVPPTASMCTPGTHPDVGILPIAMKVSLVDPEYASKRHVRRFPHFEVIPEAKLQARTRPSPSDPLGTTSPPPSTGASVQTSLACKVQIPAALLVRTR